MRKLLSKIECEHIMGGFLLLIVTITFVVLFCVTPKCSNCGNFIQTAYCVTCGQVNENYREAVMVNKSGLICPNCKVECITNYCGHCGAEPIFIEEVDAVTGG